MQYLNYVFWIFQQVKVAASSLEMSKLAVSYETHCSKFALGHGHVFVHMFQGWICSLFINYKIPFHYCLQIHPEFDVSKGPSEISRKK